jgi:DNA-binding response OmpR family regulator
VERNFFAAMSGNPISHAKPLKQLRDIYVLVVDDDHRIAQLTRSVLKSLGFQNIYLEHSAEDAMEFLKCNTIDMIICDWMMNDMDGVEMIELLRKDIKNPNQLAPVIMLSGNSERPQIETARDAGVTEYVMKPFTAKSLCNRIIAIIDNPRSFIVSPKFSGHNRRRRKAPFKGPDRRKPR